VKYNQADICSVVQSFEDKNLPTERYASFDYCFNYFQKTPHQSLADDMEKSCLALGFYLASWGMFRGSSFMIGKSSKNFEPLIEYIASLSDEVWEIDAHTFNEENIERLIETYNGVKGSLIKGSNAHLTLVTKIMLGVFGSVPAYDRFFIDSFSSIFKGQCGFRSFNKKSLSCIQKFYCDNSKVIDKLSTEKKTIIFATGQRTGLCYPRSKIIDMYGFTKGLEPSNI